MTAQTWNEVLERDDLVGGELEARRGDQWIRGVITDVLGPPSMFTFMLEWVARRAIDDPTWYAWDFDTARNFGAEQWPITSVSDDGVVTFETDQTDYRGDYWGIIYPRGIRTLDPSQVAGLPWPVEDRTRWSFPRIKLTDDEWVSLCGTGDDSDYDQEDAFPALPTCCSEVSNLREAIVKARGFDGYIWPSTQADLLRLYRYVVDGHDHDWVTLNRLMAQVPGASIPNPA